MTQERQHHLEAGFNRLKSMLSDMIENVRSSLVKAIDALDRLDGDSAKAVIDGDQVIDDLQRKMDLEICNYIGRFQPLAEDLRYVLTMMKLATDLERIGDLAVNIAEVAVRYENQTLVKPLIHIKKMTAVVENMLDEIIRAYYNRDIEVTRKVWSDDAKVDEYYVYIKREVRDKLVNMTDPKAIAQLLDLLLVARFLERAGDHATNIAEEIYYIAKGANLKEEMRR
ncbi:MAG: phosphate signaling complex protein PhoU [Mesotoga sp.]|jgi:phosphate transport system protein|nr:phosphate signaling complex protein PhoU [Mesotoga sp.]HON27689.1 phosphate signaling complex protein PhoU [Mesotoga infera]